MLRGFSISCLAIGFVASCLANTSSAQVDRVYDNKGAPLTGTVTETTADEITLETNSIPRKIPVVQIKKLVFGDEPIQLGKARDALLKGAFEDAIGFLKEIDETGIAREVVKQDKWFFELYINGQMALRGAGDKKKAADEALKFAGANRTSYHFFEVAELLGDLAFARGEFAAAGKYYGSLGRSSNEGLKSRAVVLEAKSHLAEKKYPEALAKFEQVISTSDAANTPDAKKQLYLAQVGKAVCLAGTGKPEEGLKIVEDIIAKGDPRDVELFAKAHNAMGACLLKAKRNKEALFAYLYTDVLFPGNPDAHAESLYHLAQLWKLDNKADRALRARELLKSRYAGSYWADLP